MLILRRHWVAGGKCDVTLTPALVDIYKRASEQSVSSFTITTRQSGTIIANSLTNGNGVPYFTISTNSFSPGTTTVTVTGIAFEEGYPTNIGSIIIKCRGGGKQVIDVDYADCNLDISIDNLIFDDEHGTVIFDITSTTNGTIDDSHITKIQTGETNDHGTLFIENYDRNNGYDVVVDYYRAGASTLAFPEAWHETETIHLDENVSDSDHVHAATYNIDPSLPYSVVPGREDNWVDYKNDNIVYNVSASSSPVMSPAVSISPKTFNAGTTTITATINEDASDGDLGYLVISNSCGATTNVNVRKINGVCSLTLDIDSLRFNPNTNSVTFNVTSTKAGTIDISNIAKTTTTEHRSGTRVVDVSGQCSANLTIDSVTKLDENNWNYRCTYTFTNNSNYTIGRARVTAELRRSGSFPSSHFADFVNVGPGETVTNNFYINSVYEDYTVSDVSISEAEGSEPYEYDETVVTPHVSFAPASFQAGTIQITATLSNLAEVGDLGYAIFRNDCGSTLNLNVSYSNT